MSNVEKSGFRHGEYVGYCNGARRIRRDGNGWRMEVPGCGTNGGMWFRTLRDANAYCVAHNGE